MIFLSYVKMHFSYVKSKIRHRCLNILRNFVHSKTFFTPKIHPPLITRPAPPPTPPARHPTRPATRPDPPSHPARHPTRPATPPGPVSHPTLQGCLPRQLCQPRQPRRCRERCDALVQSSSSCNGCVCGVKVNVQPPPIFYTPHLKFYVPHLKFYVPPPKFYVPRVIFYIPPPILYVNLLICGAVDTRSAWPLPPCVVNCGVEPPFLNKSWRGT